jgi:hypothetical protein
LYHPNSGEFGGIIDNQSEMNNYENPDTQQINSKSLISGKKLAKILNVSPSTLSEAVKNGYHCGGYPVIEWAEFNQFDRVEGYDVPEFLLKDQKIEEATRENPSEEKPEKVNSLENQAFQQETVVNNNYSLLPAGENYANPVGMASLSMVLKHSLGSDTPQSRAIVGGALAILGAITAHSVTDSGVAAGLGAGAGLGIALYFYKNTKNVNTESFITKPLPEQSPTNSENYNSRMLANSGYIVY